MGDIDKKFAELALLLLNERYINTLTISERAIAASNNSRQLRLKDIYEEIIGEPLDSQLENRIWKCEASEGEENTAMHLRTRFEEGGNIVNPKKFAMFVLGELLGPRA